MAIFQLFPKQKFFLNPQLKISIIFTNNFQQSLLKIKKEGKRKSDKKGRIILLNIHVYLPYDVGRMLKSICSLWKEKFYMREEDSWIFREFQAEEAIWQILQFHRLQFSKSQLKRALLLLKSNTVPLNCIVKWCEDRKYFDTM